MNKVLITVTLILVTFVSSKADYQIYLFLAGSDLVFGFIGSQLIRSLTAARNNIRFDQLWVNGVRTIRARTTHIAKLNSI